MKQYLTVCFSLFLIICIFFTPAPAAGEPVNMLSLQEGALPVVIPANYGNWHAHYLLDDSPKSGWACKSGNINDNVFVFELVETATLERFEFDNASVDAKGAGARDVLVEVSTTSTQAGYTPVLETALAALAGALLLQVGVNLANDYFDFKKGVDTAGRKGSGSADDRVRRS